MPTVIGVDPGQTTGYCVLSVPDAVLLGARGQGDGMHKHVKVRTIGQIDCTPPWENRGAQTVANLFLVDFPKAAIACEDFILDFARADKGRHTLSPVRVIAKIEMAIWSDPGYHRTDIEQFLNFQSASLAKTTCTDDRLKEWGLYDKHSGPHARDAMRHAYYFMRTCRGNSIGAAENRWLTWPHLYDDPIIKNIQEAYPKTKSVMIRKKNYGEIVEGL